VSCAKWLNRWSCRLVWGFWWAQGSILEWVHISATWRNDWTVHMWRLCNLLSNYFDHWLQKNCCSSHPAINSLKCRSQQWEWIQDMPSRTDLCSQCSSRTIPRTTDVGTRRIFRASPVRDRLRAGSGCSGWNWCRPSTSPTYEDIRPRLPSANRRRWLDLAASTLQ